MKDYPVNPPAPPEHGPLYRVAIAAVLGLVALAAIGLVPVGLGLAVTSAIVVAGCFWFGFLNGNPRLVGLVLIGLILGTYYREDVSRYAVLWTVAAALAGGMGAALTRRSRPEDDLLFLPALTGAAAFCLLAWLSEGMRIGEPLRQGGLWLAGQVAENRRVYDEAVAQGQLSQPVREAWEQIEPWFGPILMGWIMALWLPGLWLAGRLARRRAGVLEPRRAALLIFRIRPHYIFLLICAFVLWILGILTGAEKAVMVVVAPLLAVFGVACCFEGMAVLLFQIALRRTMGPPWLAKVLTLAGLAAAFLMPMETLLLATLLGLLDIWFDFRKIQSIEEQLGVDR